MFIVGSVVSSFRVKSVYVINEKYEGIGMLYSV